MKKFGKKINIKRPKITKLKGVKNINKKKFGIALILIIIAGIVVYALGAMAGLWAARPTGPATVRVLDIGDNNEDVSDEADVTVYSVSIGDKTVNELADIEFDDYKTLVDETKADKVNFYVDDNHIYKLKVKYKGTIRWFTPEAGENVVMIVDKADSPSVYLEEDDSLNRTYQGNTELDYDLKLVCDDDDEGFMPCYLLDGDDVNLIWLCFNFSRAAQESFAGIAYYHNEKVVNGTQLYIGVTGTVVGKSTYEMEFGTGKVTSYDCNNIGIFFGLEADIIPTWMS